MDAKFDETFCGIDHTIILKLSVEEFGVDPVINLLTNFWKVIGPFPLGTILAGVFFWCGVFWFFFFSLRLIVLHRYFLSLILKMPCKFIFRNASDSLKIISV